MLKGQLGQINQLIRIDAPHDHHIQFDGFQAGRFSGGQTLPDLRQVGAAGDAGKPVGAQGVQADIYAPQPGIRQ